MKDTQGYVLLPYIIVDKEPIIVDGNFNPSKNLQSRYSSAWFGKNTLLREKRNKKLKRIFENDKENDLF